MPHRSTPAFVASEHVVAAAQPSRLRGDRADKHRAGGNAPLAALALERVPIRVPIERK
jgi:hypothetical protein